MYQTILYHGGCIDSYHLPFLSHKGLFMLTNNAKDWRIITMNRGSSRICPITSKQLRSVRCTQFTKNGEEYFALRFLPSVQSFRANGSFETYVHRFKHYSRHLILFVSALHNGHVWERHTCPISRMVMPHHSLYNGRPLSLVLLLPCLVPTTSDSRRLSGK